MFKNMSTKGKEKLTDWLSAILYFSVNGSLIAIVYALLIKANSSILDSFLLTTLVVFLPTLVITGVLIYFKDIHNSKPRRKPLRG